MDEFTTNPIEENDLAQAPETPEDVAVLYTWANVHGGKYRDFSASRREYRAQQRHRQVEAQRQAELDAAREREEKAALELEEARLLEASLEKANVSPAVAEETRRRAEERAEQERQAAQKHVQTAEELRLALEQAERELEVAHRRAEEQAARYAEADARWRAQQRGMADVVPGEIADPYYYAGPLEPGAFAPGKGVRSSVPQRISSERRIVDSYYRSRGESGAEVEARKEGARRDEGMGIFDTGGGYTSRQGSGSRPIYREAPPQPSTEMAGIRPEPPEDTVERNRPDKDERRLREVAVRYDDPRSDEYYDRSFEDRPGVQLSPIPRQPSPRNSVPSDLNIPPRHPQPRSTGEGGDERRNLRAEDPAPGNTHAFDDALRSRRRESAADVLARTTRRPRLPEESLPVESYGERMPRSAAPDIRDERSYMPALERTRYGSEESSGFREDRRDASRLPERGDPQELAAGEDRSSSNDRTGFEERSARPARTHYDDRPQPAAAAAPAARDESAGREERPAWLGREARAGERLKDAPGHPEAKDREVGGRRGRDAFEELLARTADAAPRSPGDRPARSSYVERDTTRDVPADTRGGLDSGSGQEEVAERRRDSRRLRAEGGLPREVPSTRRDLSEGQTLRAADGGLNLRPMRERPPVDKLPALHDLPSVRDVPPMRDRGAYLEQNEEIPASRDVLREAAPLREAASPRESAPQSPVFSFDAERALPAPTPVPEPTWPRVERRRYERSSGSHGVEAHLDTSREYRAATRAAEFEEKSDRTRSQSARREVELREDFRNDAQTASRAEFAARSREARLAHVPSPAGTPVGTTRPGSAPLPAATDTLQQSRERVAARWFALKGLMGSNAEPTPDTPPPTRTARETTAPMLSIVALSGGVGKTSLVATLGRVLSSLGEKVLLADTTAHGLLPYYFGARELRPDVVRTFSPPPGSSDATVYMVNYETDRLSADEVGQGNLVEEISHHSKGTQRVLLDLNGSSAWLARRLARLNSSVLVPIAPDMNSVLSIQAVERFFAGTQDSEGRPVSPYYVLNQFDASLPLHLDVREVLRQQLGNRLLPVMIRRSQSVSEALAEGMTVIDYAPESPVTEDYVHLAEWVRNLAAPASVGLRSIRWSER